MINIKMPKSVIKGACQKYPKGGGCEKWWGVHLTKFQYMRYRPQILHGSLYG